jgi:hypothetical protein
VTDIIWLKDANCYSWLDWEYAISSVSLLSDGECDLSDGSISGDWRLASKEELQGIGTDPIATWYSSFPSATWTKPSGPFVNVQSLDYWSGTVYESNPFAAWFVGIHDGYTSISHKMNFYLVWPVRSPSGIYSISGAISGDILEGVTITLSGDSSKTTTTSSDGSYSFTGLENGSYTITASKIDYLFDPEGSIVEIIDTDVTGVNFTAEIDACSTVDRFVDNIDGTVTDCRTDLVWLKNARCLYDLGYVLDEYMDWDTSMSLTAGLNSGECGLSDRSAEGDWRLPTIEELQGIGTDPPATWGYGYPSVTWTSPSWIFIDLLATHYWSSTKYSTFTVWYIDLQSFNLGWSEYEPMTGNQRFAWPVRDAN